MRAVVAVAIVGMLAGPALAQQPNDVNSPVHKFRLPKQLPECGLEALLFRVAKNAGVSIGFERATTCRGHQALGMPEALKPLDVASAEVLDGVPVKDVLARIAAMAPDYDWAIMEGVPVFRPSTAWKDVDDALGLRVPAIRLSEAPANRVVGAIVNHAAMLDPRAKTGNHTLSIDFPGGTMLDAFNALARSQPVMWYASANGEKLYLHVSVIYASDGSGLLVAAPIAGLSARK